MIRPGQYGSEITLEQLWEGIEAVISRRELRDAVQAVTDMVPPPDADDDGQMRALLAARIATVSGFVKILTEVIAFGATADGMQVLAAMKDLPRLLDGRRAKNLTAGDIDADLVRGSWTRLVFPGEGRVERNAYVFCVLTQFHAKLKRRDIYAGTSTRWRDPRAQLLDGEAWSAAKDTVLTALGLPENPDVLLAAHARLLDDTYRGVAGRLAVNDAVSVDADGRLHVERIKAIPEPGSLIDLRKRVGAMLPRVDLPEVLLEVMGWEPGFAGAFTSVSGSRSRLADLNITIAACLTAHALNIGYGPVVKKGVPALERDRVGHVGLNYLRPETYSRANAPLIDRQGSIPLAQAWGGGLVASVDGMRFVVPVPTIYARPNRKFFGPKRGITWLNMIDPDIRIASSVMDYIFRRLALDHLPYDQRAELGILSAAERAAEVAGHDPAGLSEDVDPTELAQSAAVEQPHAERAVVQPPVQVHPTPAHTPIAPHSSTELIEAQQGRTADAPLCLTCGTKMRPAGSCYVCEGCGSTSGCS